MVEFVTKYWGLKSESSKKLVYSKLQLGSILCSFTSMTITSPSLADTIGLSEVLHEITEEESTMLLVSRAKDKQSKHQLLLSF